MHRASLTTVFGGSVFLASSAIAAVNAWTALGPEGGRVSKILFNPSSPATVYAIAASGFYLSVDGGATWQLKASGDLNAFSDIAFDPSNPSRIIVVGPNTQPVLQSSDAGQTFSAVMGYPSDSTYHLQWSSDGATVYASSTTDLLRSTDHGQSWQVRTPVIADESNGPVQQLLIDPNDANLLYATIADSPTTVGLYRSRDGAGSWQHLNSLSVGTYGLAIAPGSNNLWAARGDGLWVSTDAGQTWSVNQFGHAALAIAYDPSSAATLYAADNTGNIYRSPDAGASWTDISSNIEAGEISWIAVKPGQSAQILVAGLSGVAATSTTGASWNLSQSGIVATDVVSLGADPTADRVYVTADTVGLFYSAAGTQQLSAVNNLQLQYLNSPYPYWFVESALVQANGRLFVSLGNRVARSMDGGNTWEQLPFAQDTGSAAAGAFGSAPLAPTTILAGSNLSGLYRSLDSGDTWVPVSSGLPSGALVSFIAGSTSDLNTFYALTSVTSAGSALYRSTDAGVTWSATNAIPAREPGGFAIDPTDPRTLYISSLNDSYRSSDGGNSWSPLPWLSGINEKPIAFTIDPTHPRIIYAAAVTAIGRSIDAGSTWQQLPNPPHLLTWAGRLQIDPLRPYRLFAGTSSNGAYETSIEPDLALQVSDPGPALGLQTPAVYHYTVTNNGPYDATGGVLTLQLPASASAITATSTVGNCSVSGSTVTCALGDVFTGAKASVDLTTTPTAAGAFNVTGTVSADQPDPSTANNSVTSTANSAAVNTSSGGGTGGAGSNAGGGGGSGALDGLSEIALCLSIWQRWWRRRGLAMSSVK